MRRITVFGPSKYAAQMETSKRFAKNFMQQHGFPQPGLTRFPTMIRPVSSSFSYVSLCDQGFRVGGGKRCLFAGFTARRAGCSSRNHDRREFGASGDEVIIEERLEGEEISLLAFSDGKKLAIMPPAQDHKRLKDDDEGPNTGGMGAYAPAPALFKDEIAEISRTILQPVLDGLREDGHPLSVCCMPV